MPAEDTAPRLIGLVPGRFLRSWRQHNPQLPARPSRPSNCRCGCSVSAPRRLARQWRASAVDSQSDLAVRRNRDVMPSGLAGRRACRCRRRPGLPSSPHRSTVAMRPRSAGSSATGGRSSTRMARRSPQSVVFMPATVIAMRGYEVLELSASDSRTDVAQTARRGVRPPWHAGLRMASPSPRHGRSGFGRPLEAMRQSAGDDAPASSRRRGLSGNCVDGRQRAAAEGQHCRDQR